jgi:hypothetical protein
LLHGFLLNPACKLDALTCILSRSSTKVVIREEHEVEDKKRGALALHWLSDPGRSQLREKCSQFLEAI